MVMVVEHYMCSSLNQFSDMRLNLTLTKWQPEITTPELIPLIALILTFQSILQQTHIYVYILNPTFTLILHSIRSCAPPPPTYYQHRLLAPLRFCTPSPRTPYRPPAILHCLSKPPPIDDLSEKPRNFVHLNYRRCDLVMVKKNGIVYGRQQFMIHDSFAHPNRMAVL